ncbi:hypothetical protein QAD02_004349 [Eretmocerus hayati]|uniref:Uncharacterized protein n=1 Tax=Eretmocerus hayati TaxID=131215 RepID=A0ACC2NPH2_9HYME|nr:hypothetical protein QAD02_004349 [Eretmocerus hayati]
MFVKDPCGIACIITTYIAVLYADHVVVRWIVLHTMPDSLWAAFHVVIFNTMMFLMIMAHLRAVCSDPGVVPLPQTRMDFSDIHSGNTDDDHERDDWTVCTRCETYRPPRAHHCRICRRCIRKMDHHCPWINNCVGEKNQKYFIQFLVYVGALAVYAIGLVISSWMYECPQCSNDIGIEQLRMLHSAILLVESILFGLFAVAILVYQFQAILEDETAVEKVQGVYVQRRNKHAFALLAQVCGKTHPIFWLLPCNCHGPTRYSYKRDYPLIDHEV